MQEAQKRETSAAVREHLQVLQQYGERIAHAATARDVDAAMRHIADSQMALTQEGFDRVVGVNQSLQASLAEARTPRQLR